MRGPMRGPHEGETRMRGPMRGPSEWEESKKFFLILKVLKYNTLIEVNTTIQQ